MKDKEKIKLVYVTGTIGKNAVAAYMASVLRKAGYKVGRYFENGGTEYRERIQVNGRPITKKALAECLEQIPETEGAEADESAGAVAFLYFLKTECNIIFWETWGSVPNAVWEKADPIAAVFTPILCDRARFGEKEPEEIAARLQNLIGSGMAVISSFQEPEVKELLQKRAEEVGGFYLQTEERIKKVKYGLAKQSFSYGGMEKLELTLAGKEQVGYGALAIEAVRVLSTLGYPVSEKQLRKGIAEAKSENSLTVIRKKPLFLIKKVCCGAEAAELAESLLLYCCEKRMIFITGMEREWECDRIFRETVELAEHIITVSVPGDEKAMHAYELAEEIRNYHPRVTAADSAEEAVELACLLAGRDCIVVAYGSCRCLEKISQAAGKSGDFKNSPPKRHSRPHQKS